MSYPKGRKRFTVAGDSPYLSMVRDYLISQGWLLLPWDNSSDSNLALIGVDLDNKHAHPPLAQIEMMLMGTDGVEEIVLLSSPHLSVLRPNLDGWSTEARASWLFAKAAEHAFENAYGDSVLSIRPINVFGPGVHNCFTDIIDSAKSGSSLISPGRLDAKDNFIYQDDFLSALMHLLDSGITSTVDVSGGDMTYRNLLRNVWKFVHGAEEEPHLLSGYTPQSEHRADLEKLCSLGWKPQYSVRAGLFEAVK